MRLDASHATARLGFNLGRRLAKFGSGGGRGSGCVFGTRERFLLDRLFRLVAGIIISLAGRLVLLPLLGHALLVRVAFALLLFNTQHLGTETRVAHAGGMAVGNLLGQYGIVGDLVPVDLEASKLIARPSRQAISPRGTYILEAFLLQDSEQEAGHGVVVGRHDEGWRGRVGVARVVRSKESRPTQPRDSTVEAREGRIVQYELFTT